jgi:hypothetical protein
VADLWQTFYKGLLADFSPIWQTFWQHCTWIGDRLGIRNVLDKSRDGVAPNYLQYCSSKGSKRASQFLNLQMSSKACSRSEKAHHRSLTDETRMGALKKRPV